MQESEGAAGTSLQPQLLPVNNKKNNAPPILHAKGPASKRVREDTPSPQKETTGTDWHGRIAKDMVWAKGKIGTAAQGFKTDKIVSLADSLKDFCKVTLVDILERQANTSSDLVTEVMRLTAENGRLNAKLAKQEEDIVGVKLCKDKAEVKSSKKEMEEKIKIAVTQVKVTDLDLGKEITDRKEMVTAAKEALAAKVRSDLRKEYEERIKHATFKVVTSKTFKNTVDGKDVWNAPLIVTVPDRENRWALENCMRCSKVYPSFHWPREMVDNVKIYRQAVKDMGYKDNEYYIRIRPEERDGGWKIRADVKPKNGVNTKFTSVASFDIPPMDDKLKSSVSGWAKPTWMRKQNGPRNGADGMEVNMTDVDFTEDDVIYNM
jgi:undecaprenyl pyrophosphate synthase